MLLTAYIFAIGSGISFSHIHCEHGERWVLGSEMPPKKHSQTEDKRQKETFHFFMKIDAEPASHSTPNFKLQPQLKAALNTPLNLKQNTRASYKARAYTPHFPKPPTRAQLQVFII